MDDIEQRIADALRAEASRVTEESLRLPEHLERPRPRRWQALVAATGVVATGAAVAGVLAIGGDRSEPRPMPPVQTTSQSPQVTSTTSVPPTNSSQLTSSGTTSSGGPGTGTPSRTAQPPPPPQCGGKPCRVVQSVFIGPETLEVLAAESAEYPGSLADWKVWVRGGAVLPGAPDFDSFVDVDSLRCTTVIGRAVCLLHTSYLGDSDTWLGIVKQASEWRFTGVRFPTPYGALDVDVRDLGGDRTLDVVSVEAGQGDGPEPELWTATVWRWDGVRLGCAPRVSTKEELPGWPNVAPDPSTLDARHCFWQS